MATAEILAPVGSPEALTAAVRCGANAVYMGLGDFNARRNATNFDRTGFAGAVKYCHARNVKVHLTLNTLVSDGELERALDTVKFACDTGVDAIIVQDLGLASLIRQAAPSMPLHGSTQMSVHTPSGVRFLHELGFTRAVLARELSLDELREIAEASPIELEVFVHGALCMSVSGQCYLSAMIGQRSGNRGLCAQPCRLPFAVDGGTGRDLSLKDMSLIDRVGELASLGISSFKIEGRMKRPEYVAAAVTACRNALEGRRDDELTDKLRSVFSRSGFTDGYLTGKRGRDMFGTRRHEDVTAAQPVLSSLANLYHKERPLLPVKMSFSASVGEKCKLSVSCLDRTAKSESENVCEAAISRPLTVEAACVSLGKCGSTYFYADAIDCAIGDNVSVPVLTLNRLRRDCLERLEERLSEPKRHGFTPDGLPQTVKRQKTDKTKLMIRLADISQLSDRLLDMAEYIVLPVETAQDKLSAIEKKEKVILELPRGMFGLEKKLDGMIKDVKRLGFDSVLAENVGAVQLARENGMRVTGGFGLNAFNSHALGLLDSLGAERQILSFELSAADICRIEPPIPFGVIGYGYLPLMLTRNCPLANGKASCAGCTGGSIRDRKSVDFRVKCRTGASELFNSRPLYMGDRKDELNAADFHVLYFTREDADEALNVARRYVSGAEYGGEYTRGLYYRKVY